ncbi:MAG: tetratricopeptide repeat protein [Thermodesulfobacteriota bacterium]|nr:tetratricopeptide repeat protein [Thermodesulfobacteriota bacterium]
MAGLLLTAVAVVICSGPVSASDGSCLLVRAGAMYRQRVDLNKARQAVDLFRRAAAADASGYEASWKLARSLCWVIEHGPREGRTALAEEAVAAAQKAVAIKPDSPAGHFWLGIAYGYLGDARGVLKSLSLINPIMEEMKKVIELDPGHEGGGGYMAIGRLYHLLPGNNSQAIKYLETALKYGPRRWVNHLYLAEVYLDEGRKEEARGLLRLIVAGPAEPGLEPEYAEFKTQAEELLKTF